MFGRKGLNADLSAQPARSSSSLLADEMQAIAARAGDCHPLVTAARIVSLMSPNLMDETRVDYIRIVDIDRPSVLDLPDHMRDETGLSFSFFGEAGEAGIVYLTTVFGQIVPQGENPRDRLEERLISKIVPDYRNAVRAVAHKIQPPRSRADVEAEKRLRSSLREFLG